MKHPIVARSAHWVRLTAAVAIGGNLALLASTAILHLTHIGWISMLITLPTCTALLALLVRVIRRRPHQ